MASRRVRSKSPRAGRSEAGAAPGGAAVVSATETATGAGGTVAVAAGAAKVGVTETPLRKLLVRMGIGLLMIGVFLSILYSHHWIVVAFVVLLQVASFRELIGVRFKEVKEQQLPFFRTLSWFAFCICEFAAYGRQVMEATGLGVLVPYHGAIAFGAFVLYFTLFVLSLKKKKLYKYQMTQLAWTWLVLLLVVGQAWGAWWNIFRGGIFWFLLPAGLIVCNDIWAYFCGLAFGKRFFSRPFLPALSPNKTWEGFGGAFLFTLLFMPPMVYLFQMPDFWACPHSAMDAAYSLLGGVTGVTISPVYLHGLVLAVFASLIAPFGGFFASGVKRAFGKKDFDSLFPGHGGVVDRMDCQMIMQLFVWIYLRTFVFPSLSLDGVLGIVALWPRERQLRLLSALQQRLK